MSATITVLRDTAITPAGLVWEDPPAKKNQSGKYAALAAALRERPGQWAVVRTYDTTQSKRAWGFCGSIRVGKLVDLRGGFEAVARTVGSEVRVYARFAPVTEVSA